jgi:uncharacterized tellurite resistance protein B-like protein
MSLISTLGKVAIGVMVAKTVGKAISGGSGGGLGDMLGGLIGGGSKEGSSSLKGDKLPDLMNSLGDSKDNPLGDLLSNVLQGKEVQASPSEEERAAILLKALINAAKADGVIDEKEKAKITEHIGDVTPQELEIVKETLNEELNLEEFINSIPRGMEEQVYLMSLLAIDLDSNQEAHYLDRLAKGLGISQEMANSIHERVGAPKIYRS